MNEAVYNPKGDRCYQKTVLEGLPSVTELSSAPEIRPFLDQLDPSAPV